MKEKNKDKTPYLRKIQKAVNTTTIAALLLPSALNIGMVSVQAEEEQSAEETVVETEIEYGTMIEDNDDKGKEGLNVFPKLEYHLSNNHTFAANLYSNCRYHKGLGEANSFSF